METISLFDTGLESFVRKYEKRYHEVIKYIYENVLVNKEFFAYAWTNEQQMNKMHESQLVTVKAEFQQSMTFIKHEHNIHDFKGLHIHMSQYALNFITSEIRRLEKSKTIVAKYCGCIVYKTHGLPCAHMIYEYRNQSKLIQLYFIDWQWRQINLVPHVSRSDDVFDYLPQLEILRK
ncbi:hypothetical protein MKX01_039982 [Papaver californicum]|nr:hypothetical protein MKX01_039982 [Papaver californicum]